MKKVLLYLFMIAWGLFFAVGIFRNFHSYSILEWILVLATALLPYIIIFFVRKKKLSNPEPPNTGTKSKKGIPIALAVLLGIVVLGGITIGIRTLQLRGSAGAPSGRKKELAGEYMDLETVKIQRINDALKAVGIEEISSMAHDEMLDNAHFDGEKGYRIVVESPGPANAIMYLDKDDAVYTIRHADYALYADGKAMTSIDDYVVTFSEQVDYKSEAEKLVKQILKAPSTAKFVPMSEWRFRQEGNIMDVEGYVDAENSFGAMIRSHFSIVFVSGIAESFVFDGQELIAR